MGSNHLELPRLSTSGGGGGGSGGGGGGGSSSAPGSSSPIRASFASSSAQSDFINSYYIRDSTSLAGGPPSSSSGRASSSISTATGMENPVGGGAAWTAFSSSRRDSSRPVSPVLEATPLGDTLGLGPLGSTIETHGLRRRSSSSSRLPFEGTRNVGGGGSEVSGSHPLFDAGSGVSYLDPFQSPSIHSAGGGLTVPHDLGEGSSRSHQLGAIDTSVASGRRLTTHFAQDPADFRTGRTSSRDDGIHLEEGRSKRKSRRKPRGPHPITTDTPTSPNVLLSPTLTRKGTLAAAAAEALRRASVRVVNLDNSTIEEAPTESITASPNLRRSPTVRRTTPDDSLEDKDVVKEEEEDEEEEEEEEVVPLPPLVVVLRGKSLGLFGPQNPIRKFLFRAFRLPVTEPLILGLIVADMIILTIQASPNVFLHPRPTKGYFHSWEDYALFVLFCLFTVEMFARIIVAGLVINTDAEERKAQKARPKSERPRSMTLQYLTDKLKAHEVYAQRRPGESTIDLANGAGSEKWAYRASGNESSIALKPSIVLQTGEEDYNKDAGVDVTDEPIFPPPKRTFTADSTNSFPISPSSQRKFFSDTPFLSAVARQRTLIQTAYLRHSWNRVDCVAIVAYWISFALAETGLEAEKNIYIFRALSVLRAARLLTITSGTTTILRSLKRAGPLLLTVLYFIVFAGVLFSIVGVQSFKGSLLRSCVWIDPTGVQNFTLEGQSCGGQFDNTTGAATGFIQSKTGSPFTSVKGFVCPQGQLCLEIGNPNNNTESFDNVGWAALQVAVIASANTWSNLMYSIMDAEFFISSLFFIFCLLLLNFWLFNIMVAVITNTFSDIVDETKHSAFSAGSAAAPRLGEDTTSPAKKPGLLMRINHWADYFWVLVILADFVLQATQNAAMSLSHKQLLSNLELGFTAGLGLEVILRFLGYLPDWRQFFLNGKNLTDTGLAIVTLIIQIPPIRNSEVYPWLTFFQIMRFYRVILAVPRMKNLLRRLRGSFKGLVNMIVFLLGINFVASLIAVQYFRGLIPQSPEVEMSFYQMWNSILAMYQIFSSENWTNVLYSGTAAQSSFSQAWLAAIFLAGWFIFANFVLLQMFIAVISEGFAVPEDAKHKEQLRNFMARIEPEARTARWYARLNPYKYLRTQPSAMAVAVHYANLPSNIVLPMRKSMVRDMLAAKEEAGDSRFIQRARRAFRLDRTVTMRASPRTGHHDDGVDLTAAVPARTDFAMDELDEARAAQADLINLHPTYDKSLWILSQKNPLRKFCQSIVEPSYGERLFGTQTNPRYRNIYQSIVFVAIVGSVVVVAIATPPYRQSYFLANGDVLYTWFNWVEVSLGTIFVVEFLIKVIADGFLFCPNAYLLSVWNGIDFFVLVTFITDLSASIIFSNSTSRLVRSLKAFRALRLINLSRRIRQTFFDVFIIGFSSLFDASVLTILYILPFGVWGMNIFSGLLYTCSDGSAQGKTSCLGEYVDAPRQVEFLMPRAWNNPYVWSFDSFKSAILILFEIISLEGWINVMTSLMAITGLDQQPAQDASQSYAIYSVTYNLLGATVILTLFLTVIINNFLKRSGSAYLTSDQQQWINIRKLIYRQRPSRRPREIPTGRFRQWCYQRVIQKHGWWSRMLTALYVVHIALLMTQTRSNTGTWVDPLRDGLFLLFGCIYTVDVVIRLYGLGWISFYQNGWNLYDVAVIAGTFATTIPVMINEDNGAATQLQKLFLVLIAFKLTVKSNLLNQLFKTAIASLPSIAELFALWLILFLVWGMLYVETFSLTRLGPSNLTRYSNYQSFPKALVMLAIQSTGEGWNSFMHDYTIEAPYCISSTNYLFNDCGSAGWAFALFISWNVISMYIILNMFTGLVVENFAYVFELYGKVKAINREEVREFKKVWADFDRNRTGYITTSDYIPFFARLTGVFDVNLYPPQLRIKALKAACSTKPSSALPTGRFGDEEPYAQFLSPDEKQRARYSLQGFDVSELQKKLGVIDGKAVRRKKVLLTRLHQEALMTERPGKGMSFTAMMLLLAHYKLIDDKALRLEELVERKERLERVDDRVEFNRIQGIFKTVLARRLFLRHLRNKRQAEAMRHVPEIMVEQDSSSPVLRSPSSGSSSDSFERPSLTPLSLKSLDDYRTVIMPPQPRLGGTTSRTQAAADEASWTVVPGPSDQNRGGGGTSGGPNPFSTSADMWKEV